LFYAIFIRIALVEEASRLIILIPFFIIAAKSSEQKDSSFGAALGLAAGLGFAIIESTYHGISDLSITILRLFTAAPLHGTCGIRAGTAIFSFRRYPARSIFLFASTVLIHGTYNLIIVSPAYPSAIAIIITFAALFASLNQLKAADTESDD
jgi:RsiW-degrading membrane proteinase PrsW (M82 family)